MENMILNLDKYMTDEEKSHIGNVDLTINTSTIDICPETIPLDRSEFISLDELAKEEYEIVRDFFTHIKANKQNIKTQGIAFAKRLSQEYDAKADEFVIQLDIGTVLRKKSCIVTCRIPTDIIAEMAVLNHIGEDMTDVLNEFYDCIKQQICSKMPDMINATSELPVSNYYLALYKELDPLAPSYQEPDCYCAPVKTVKQFKANQYALSLLEQSGGHSPLMFLKLKMGENVYNTIRIARDRYGYLLKVNPKKHILEGYLGLRFLSYDEPYMIVALETCESIIKSPIFIWNNVLLSLIRHGINCPISADDLKKQLIEYSTGTDDEEDIF